MTISRVGARQREEWEVAGMRVPPKQASKRAKTGSGNRHEATGQTTDNSMFGSGGSAFRVGLLATPAVPSLKEGLE
jgi:hypothetical protein